VIGALERGADALGGGRRRRSGRGRPRTSSACRGSGRCGGARAPGPLVPDVAAQQEDQQLFEQRQQRIGEILKRRGEAKCAAFFEHAARGRAAQRAAARTRREWSAWLECSPLPNPKVESELNSYLTLWRGDHVEVRRLRAAQR
jgi:hypothetical protein